MDFQLPSRCLVCYKNRGDDDGSDEKADLSWGRGRNTSVSSQLHVIFILRKVFDIPMEELSRYLQRWGEGCHPDKWIWTCSSCSGLIDEARKIHEEIVLSKRRLGAVKKRIVGKVKESATPQRRLRKSAVGVTTSVADVITNESRNCVIKRKYDEIRIDDPYHEGDLKASQLAIRIKSFNKEEPDRFDSTDLTPVVKEELQQEEEWGGLDCNDDAVMNSNNMDLDDFEGGAVLKELVCEPEGMRMSSSAEAEVNADEGPSDEEDDNDKRDSDWIPDNLNDEEVTESHGISKISKTTNRTSQHVCEDCGAKLCGKYNLKRHMVQVHKKGTLAVPRKKITDCDLCGKRFSFPCKLKKHMRFHLNNKDRPIPKTRSDHVCGECGARLCGKYNLKRHMVQVHKMGILAPKEKITECDVCGKKFSFPCKLKKHMRSHLKAKDRQISRSSSSEHVCKMCGARLCGKYNLKRHLVQVHKIGTLAAPKKVLNCGVCGKRFPSSHKLRRHMGTHQKVKKSYDCEFCSQSFTDYRSLRDHKLKVHHELLDKFLCDHCPQRWKERKDLERHMARKHGIGKYPCTEESCRRVFHIPGLLNSHIMNVHMKGCVAPYQCEQCGKAYCTDELLTRHVAKKHPSEMTRRKFKCSHCDKEFYKNYDLRRHEQTHAPKTQHKCHICGTIFSHKGLFTRHMNSRHDASADRVVIQLENKLSIG